MLEDFEYYKIKLRREQVNFNHVATYLTNERDENLLKRNAMTVNSKTLNEEQKRDDISTAINYSASKNKSSYLIVDVIRSTNMVNILQATKLSIIQWRKMKRKLITLMDIDGPTDANYGHEDANNVKLKNGDNKIEQLMQSRNKFNEIKLIG